VDARGLHSFVCRRAPGRSARHHALNDLVARCFASAGTLVTKDPNRVVPHWRKEVRWSNTRPVAERQVFMLWRDGHMPSGRIIRHWVRPRGRCCSGTCHFSQTGKICQHWKRIPLCAHRGCNLGPDEHVGWPTVCQSRKKDLLGVRRWQERSFSVPESFGAGAALQCCIATWPLASHWLHGLMICTHLCIILIFKLPREHKG